LLVGIVGSVAYVTARREGGRLLAGGGGGGVGVAIPFVKMKFIRW